MLHRARDTALCLVLAFFSLAVPAHAQAPDTILVNGKIVTYDAAPAEALAVRGDTIAAIGTSAGLPRAGRPRHPRHRSRRPHRHPRPDRFAHPRHPRRADLADRGALDRRPHAGRGARPHPRKSQDRAQGLVARRRRRLDRAAVRRGPPPDAGEIAAAAPDHHVYVQQLYSRVLLSPGGYEALDVARDQTLAGALTVERDPEGASRPAGSPATTAPSATCSTCCRARPSRRRSKARARSSARSTPRAHRRDRSRRLQHRPIPDYQPLFQVWRERGLTLRVRYSLCAPRRGRELEDFKELTQVLPMGFGDDWLRFNGIGENVTWGMYNNDTPTEAQKELYREVASWAAERGMTLPSTGTTSGRSAICSRCSSASTPRRRLPGCAGRSRISTTPRRRRLRRMKAMGRRLAHAERVLFPRRGLPRPARPGDRRLAADRQRAATWAFPSAAAPTRTG